MRATACKVVLVKAEMTCIEKSELIKQLRSKHSESYACSEET